MFKTATLENLIVFRGEDGKINGHIERYTCEPANNTKTQELFGIDNLV